MVDGEWWMVTTLIRRIYDNERDGKLNKKKMLLLSTESMNLNMINFAWIGKILLCINEM